MCTHPLAPFLRSAHLGLALQQVPNLLCLLFSPAATADLAARLPVFCDTSPAPEDLPHHQTKTNVPPTYVDVEAGPSVCCTGQERRVIDRHHVVPAIELDGPHTHTHTHTLSLSLTAHIRSLPRPLSLCLSYSHSPTPPTISPTATATRPRAMFPHQGGQGQLPTHWQPPTSQQPANGSYAPPPHVSRSRARSSSLACYASLANQHW